MTLNNSDNTIDTLLPDYIQQWLNSCPKAGTGVNLWLINTATRLHRFFDDKECIAALLEKHSADCGREVSSQEVWRAINNSEKWLAEQNGAPQKSSPKPKPAKRKRIEPDIDLIKSVIAAGPTLEQLRGQSPVACTAAAPHTEEIISTLFPPDSLVCVGASKINFKTVRLEPMVRLGLFRSLQFIVPSPMSARLGKTKEGKMSAHSLDNTGLRRFHVVEFDPLKYETLSAEEQKAFPSAENYYRTKRDEHAAMLWHLAQRERLVLAVHSGGKSIHGWFFVEGRSEEVVNQFMEYAERLGADPATKLKSQFVRMPGGLRDNGKRQQVVYYNPNKMEAK
jgi:hypothetical protein